MDIGSIPRRLPFVPPVMVSFSFVRDPETLKPSGICKKRPRSIEKSMTKPAKARPRVQGQGLWVI